MEYFYSSGGSNRPNFIYRFTVKRSSLREMMQWANDYPIKGPFSRYHVIFNSRYPMDDQCVDREEVPLIQFELRDAYVAFKWAFAGEILEDQTWEDFRLD